MSDVPTPKKEEEEEKEILMQEIQHVPNDVECITHFLVITKEQKRFLVPKKFLESSPVIRNVLLEGESGGVEVPLLEIEAEILQRVLEFQKHHFENPMEEIAKPLRVEFRDVVSDWDFDFFRHRLLQQGDKEQNKILLRVLEASNFLILLPLRDLCCAAIASLLRNQTESEIVAFFNDQESIPAESREALYKENSWLREDA